MADCFDVAEKVLKQWSINSGVASEKDHDFLGEDGHIPVPLKHGHVRLSYVLSYDEDCHTDAEQYPEANVIAGEMLRELKKIWAAIAKSLPPKNKALRYFVDLDPVSCTARLKSHTDGSYLEGRVYVKKDYHKDSLADMMVIRKKDVVDEIMDLVYADDKDKKAPKTKKASKSSTK
jgi:hypothetical protein